MASEPLHREAQTNIVPFSSEPRMMPLAPSAHAGAIVDIVVDAVIGELVGAGVAIMLMSIHNPISAAVCIKLGHRK